ncbi:MAG: DUF2752 domain-containing protein [Firmicutes bacterium]|nr:DUF2752 domain-containing protein [Bacillota bacterium]
MNKPSVKSALKKQLFAVLLIIGIGICYFVWLKLTGIPIPCVFYKLTGFKCPGCGVTTMIMCLSSLDFEGAFSSNPFLFLTGPLLLAELIYYFYIRTIGKRLPRWNERALIVYTAALCVFGAVRNFM